MLSIFLFTVSMKKFRWSVEFHSYFTVIMRCCCSIDKVDNSRGYQGRSVCCAGCREKCCTGNGDTFGLATCLIRSSLRKMGYGRESLFVDKVLVKGLRQHKRYHD